MENVVEEFDRIKKAYKKVATIFEEMQLSPSEGLAVLALLQDNTLYGMNVEIFGKKDGIRP